MSETLLDSLAGLRPDSRLLLRDERLMMAGDLVSAALGWRCSVGAGCEGRVVLVSLHSVDILACVLAALDGFAKAVVLAPESIDAAGVAAFAAAAEAEIFVGDGDCPSGLRRVDAPVLMTGALGSARVAAPASTAWLLATSGTTGRPKLYAHSFASLTASARGPSERSSEFCWGLLYDPHRFAGLQVLLQCLVAGSPLCVPESSSDMVSVITTFRKLGVNSLSATPSLWRRLLMVPGFGGLPLKQITLGGEIADQAILDTIKFTFPRARMVHIYACTEAGVAFSVKDGREGFPRSYLETPPAEVEVKIDTENVLYLRPAGFRPIRLDSSDSTTDDGFIRTGDRVVVVGDRIRFLGRESGLINVGGLKVLPEEVERVLLGHPAVAMVRVQGRRNSIAGQLVEAEVGLHPGHPASPALVAGLRTHCAAHLPPHKIPALIRFISDFRLSTTGKIERSSSA